VRPSAEVPEGETSMMSDHVVDFFLRKFKILFLTGMTYAALC
jgi:hypothetical protein